MSIINDSRDWQGGSTMLAVGNLNRIQSIVDLVDKLFRRRSSDLNYGKSCKFQHYHMFRKDWTSFWILGLWTALGVQLQLECLGFEEINLSSNLAFIHCFCSASCVEIMNKSDVMVSERGWRKS